MINANKYLGKTKTLLSAAYLTALMAGAAQADDLSFLIFNNSSADLVEFNVSPSNSDSWEGNLMSGGYLAPGYEIDVLIADGLTTCVYDLRGVFDDGSRVEDYELNLCDLGQYTFTD